MNIKQAIKRAESILPETPAAEGETDPRWQAIIDISEFAKTNPEEVWTFVARWGIHEDPDLRSAIATCLLEHLLEHHFESMFPRVEILTRKNSSFAETFKMCWQFGETLQPNNSKRFNSLLQTLAT